jgi:hypothetical protein
MSEDNGGQTEVEEAPSDTPSEKATTENQQMKSGESSAPSDENNRGLAENPRFRQMAEQRRIALEKQRQIQQELEIERKSRRELEERIASQKSTVQVSEGLQPFEGDIRAIVNSEIASVKSENERLKQELRQDRLGRFEKEVRSQETAIRKKAYNGRPSYDDVIELVQTELEANPNSYSDIESVYLKVTKSDHDKYVTGLEAKLKNGKAATAKASATPGTSTPSSASISKPKSFREAVMQQSKAALDGLNVEE